MAFGYQKEFFEIKEGKLHKKIKKEDKGGHFY
jgi:hypothetical protein